MLCPSLGLLFPFLVGSALLVKAFCRQNGYLVRCELVFAMSGAPLPSKLFSLNHPLFLCLPAAYGRCSLSWLESTYIKGPWDMEFYLLPLESAPFWVPLFFRKSAKA